MSVKHLTKGSKQPPLQKGKLRLYSMRFCPYAQRVHLVLDAKKIPYDVVYINLGDKPDWFLEKSPLGKVPAIEIDGQVLYESLIIADFLDERFPTTRPLHPKDPMRKAQEKLLVEHFNHVITIMYKVWLHSGRSTIEDYVDVIMQGLERLENELGERGGQFFGGSQPGMLDYMVWPWCERAELLKFYGGEKFALNSDRFKRLVEWRVAMREDPAVKCSMLQPEQHVKYLQARRAGVPDYDHLSQL